MQMQPEPSRKPRLQPVQKYALDLKLQPQTDTQARRPIPNTFVFNARQSNAERATWTPSPPTTPAKAASPPPPPGRELQPWRAVPKVKRRGRIGVPTGPNAVDVPPSKRRRRHRNPGDDESSEDAEGEVDEDGIEDGVSPAIIQAEIDAIRADADKHKPPPEMFKRKPRKGDYPSKKGGRSIYAPWPVGFSAHPECKTHQEHGYVFDLEKGSTVKIDIPPAGASYVGVVDLNDSDEGMEIEKAIQEATDSGEPRRRGRKRKLDDLFSDPGAEDYEDYDGLFDVPVKESPENVHISSQSSTSTTNTGTEDGDLSLIDLQDEDDIDQPVASSSQHLFASTSTQQRTNKGKGNSRTTTSIRNSKAPSTSLILSPPRAATPLPPLEIKPARSNLYHTGRNLDGRVKWTAEEDQCLLNGLSEIHSRGNMLTPWAQVLKLHGPQGTSSQGLGNRNPVQLKDRARNIAIRLVNQRKAVPDYLQFIKLPEKRVGGKA